MTDRSPDTQLSEDSDESTTGLKSKKRKTSPGKVKLSAANAAAPGLRQEVALKHGKTARELGTKLTEIVVAEAGKKKLSQMALREIQTVKEEYQNLVDELILENTLLLGRLWEARASDEAKDMELKQAKSSVKSRSGPKQPEVVNLTLDEDLNQQPVSKNRRRKNALKTKKQVRIQSTSEQHMDRPETDATTDGNTDAEFTEVRRKTNNRSRRKAYRRHEWGRNGCFGQPQDTKTSKERQDQRTQKT